MSTTAVRAVWECNRCHFRYEDPIGVLTVQCPNRHRGANRMVRIWAKGDGPMPSNKEEE